TVPREIEGHDGQPVAQRPADHMAVQAHVVVVTVQNDQRAPRQARAPYLNRQVETINFNVTKVLIDLGAEVDSVIGGVLLCGRIEGLPRFELRQLRDKPFEKRLIHQGAFCGDSGSCHQLTPGNGEKSVPWSRFWNNSMFR